MKSTLRFYLSGHDSSISQNLLVYFLPSYYIPGWSTISLVVSIIPIGKSLKWDNSRGLVLHVHSKTNLKLKWEIYLSDSTSMYHLVDVHETSEQEDTALLNVGLLEHEPSCMRIWNTKSATNTASKTPA